MKDYARTTSVSVEKSRAEIEKLLLGNGAGQIMSAFDVERGSAIVGWSMAGRMVRLSIPLPDGREKWFTHRRTRSGYAHKPYPESRRAALWEQACRARWRSVVLILKAKFEAIRAGVSTVEREFLADTLLADGNTVGAWIAPQLAAVYERREMPRLLPGVME